jgi:hypothetical protein
MLAIVALLLTLLTAGPAVASGRPGSKGITGAAAITAGERSLPASASHVRRCRSRDRRVRLRCLRHNRQFCFWFPYHPACPLGRDPWPYPFRGDSPEPWFPPSPPEGLGR